MSLNDKSIALIVHGRLRRKHIHLHRSLVRLITRHVLDVLTEAFPAEWRAMLDGWLAGAPDRKKKWPPLEDAIRKRYSLEAHRDRVYKLPRREVWKRYWSYRTWAHREITTLKEQLEERVIELTDDEVRDLAIMCDHLHLDEHRALLGKLIAHYRR